MKNLVVFGLGNEGLSYVNTRHNIGYMVLTCLNTKVKRVKPSGFINDSGKFIKKYIDKHKIDITDILVVFDDYQLDFGDIRLREKGSSTHNGVKDIINELGTDQFMRLRIGIGSNFKKGELIDYVLSDFNSDEMKQISVISDRCSEIINYLCNEDIQKTKTKYGI